MAKIRQKNWLLIITVLLLVSSVLILIITTEKNLGIGLCLYNGIEYQQEELVPDYNGRNDCYCSKSGDVICEESEVNMSYESFTSSNLSFTYSFRNFLDKTTLDLGKITLTDINHQSNKIEIIIEREALCGEDGVAPTQIGLYKSTTASLILTTVTNRDNVLYERNCLIGNSFTIENFNVGQEESFSILYQNESGQLYDLGACLKNNKLYSIGDVFKDSESNRLCTCEGSEVKCEDL